jgi:uncharacterized surface protein with fasciclin (FAS1) repeats
MKIIVRKVASTLVAATLSCAVMAMPALAEKPKWADKSEDDIVKFAVEASGGVGEFDNNGGDFDILIAALVATNTIAIFNGTDYTVFAPTDQAFYDLTGTKDDEAALGAVLGLLSLEEISGVLAYHVTEGVRNSRTVTRARQITMLDGNTISYMNNLIVANESTAGLLDIDNRLADGMVHVIDTVLLAGPLPAP